jgi:hypothetical protein
MLPLSPRAPLARVTAPIALAHLAAFAALTAFSPRAAAAPPPGRAERCVAAAEQGQQQRDRAAFVEARASFRACAADECPALVRKDCSQWLSDVDTNIPSVVLGARDARGNDVTGARILVDGKGYQDDVDAGRAITLNPGPHTFRFEHAPDAPVELTLVLRTGERNRPIFGTFGAAPSAAPGAQTTPVPLPAASPPAAPSHTPATHVSAWAYALGGVAIAGVASFAAFGATGLDEKNQLRAQCGNTCSDAQVDPLKVKYITADVSLGVGIVAAVISTWLFLHPSREERAEPAMTLSLGPSRDGASVGMVGRF